MTDTMQATVFIGNPSSTLSAFIARSRVALGHEHSYLCRARNERGEWDQARRVPGKNRTSS